METPITEIRQQCKRCSHKWNQRTKEPPKQCPKCKQYTWQEEAPKMFKHHCNKCSWDWKTPLEKPRVCASCRTRYWDAEYEDIVIEEEVQIDGSR